MNIRVIFGLVAVTAIPGAYAGSVTINSGAGVTFLDSGSQTTDFSSPFTAANFTAAQTGTAAAILTSTPSYLSSLPSGPGAVWIGTNSSAGTGAGDTALYAVSFDIPTPFVSGSLTLFFGVDNELGDLNPGIYINGIALPASTAIPGSGTSSFTTQNTYTDANIGADLVQGTNWLYFDAVNLGAPAGLIFSANIATVNSVSTIPEPESIWLIGGGLIAVGAVWGRKRNSKLLDEPQAYRAGTRIG